jgi:hypothetical protein
MKNFRGEKSILRLRISNQMDSEVEQVTNPSISEVDHGSGSNIKEVCGAQFICSAR